MNQYFVLISGWESMTNDWEMKGPFPTLEVAATVRDNSDFTKEHYIVNARQIAAMCRLACKEDGEFIPPEPQED